MRTIKITFNGDNYYKEIQNLVTSVIPHKSEVTLCATTLTDLEVAERVIQYVRNKYKTVNLDTSTTKEHDKVLNKKCYLIKLKLTIKRSANVPICKSKNVRAVYM